MPFPFTIVMELLCLLACIFLFRNMRTSWWHIFIPFLLFTLVVEVIGLIIVIYLKETNYWVFNIYMPIKFAFFLFTLSHIARQFFSTRIWIITGLFLFCVLYICEIVVSGFFKYCFYSNLFISLWIAVLCCQFLYAFMKKNDYINLNAYAPFWIIAGFLSFNLGSAACNIFFNQLTAINRQLNMPVRFIIFNVLSLILYTCWTYAFVCRYRHTISSSR